MRAASAVATWSKTPAKTFIAALIAMDKHQPPQSKPTERGEWRSTRQLCSYVPGSGAQGMFDSLAGDGTPVGASEAGGAAPTAAQSAVPALLRSGKASRKTQRPRNGAGNNGNYVALCFRNSAAAGFHKFGAKSCVANTARGHSCPT